MPRKEEPGVLASAGPLECASTPPAPSLNSQNHTVDQTISALAELFPAAFTKEKWKPHRPLKRGVHQDLIDRGVLLPNECRAVLRRYVSRRMYQVALAAGGPRYGLDGEPAGEVTADQIASGKALVAIIEAKRARKAKAVADEWKAAVRANSAASPKEMQPATAARSAKPSRLSLVDLKAAARARRETVT